jgi:hypothetical protein
MKMKRLKNKILFSEYFKDVFGKEPDSMPNIVYVVENNKKEVVGFIGGHKNFDGCFYIEYAGIISKFRKGAYLRNLHFILESLKGSFITAVDNKNTETMRILLSLNFFPIGFRTAGNTSYVEWMRY